MAPKAFAAHRNRRSRDLSPGTATQHDAKP